ncbi:MAG: hypothetical protein RLZZ04_95 [Cyanobacteriota bacterium]|jgi:hypothetical protein
MKPDPYRGKQGQRNRDTIIAHFAQEPDDWISIGELAVITGCSTNSTRVHCYNLFTTGYLEETTIWIGDRHVQHFRRSR